MLRELHIENLAVIERASVELSAGLNVFTGQTGAGKSLLIGALELLLGIRRGGKDCVSLIRAGADEARVTGLFDLSDDATRRDIAALLDRPLPDDEPMLITRRVFASGRSSVSVNGEPATAGMLQAVGQRLVDIHGQHDQQYLLRPFNQLLILDAFGNAEGLRNEFAATYSEWRTLLQRLDDLRAGRAERERRRELMEFQAEEISAAAPHPGEFEQLSARHAVLINIGTLQAQAGQVACTLTDGDDTLGDRMHALARSLEALAKLDPEHLGSLAEQFTDATEMVHDIGRQLSRYVESLDADPDELQMTEHRLDVLNRLIHKYGSKVPGDDALAAVLRFRAEIGQQLETIENDEADLAGIESQIDQQLSRMTSIGAKLTKARRKAAKALAPLVEAQLKDLGMADARFEAAITSCSIDSPQVGPTGLDSIEFMIQPNPGQAANPLRAIASGGELSRVMLALKSILAGSDRVSVMVFDEIDANIGGRLGGVIGRKMHQLANREPASGATHQVLCITHLPQIAAYADTHLHIAKAVSGSDDERQTHTSVMQISGERREAELAEMIGGENHGQTALAQARQLLDDAAVSR
jgi:DNA repair protein RecN (Recombination protein N)